MKHRHAVDLAEPLRYVLRASVILALLGLPAVASDRPEAIRLPDTGRFPENVTLASNATLFVSSLTEGGVIEIEGAGAVTAAFLKPGDRGTCSTFGLLADEKRGMLWVASNDATTIEPKGPTTSEGGKGVSGRSTSRPAPLNTSRGPGAASDQTGHMMMRPHPYRSGAGR